MLTNLPSRSQRKQRATHTNTSVCTPQLTWPDGHGRLWPNRLWPNRLWPIWVFSVLAKFSGVVVVVVVLLFCVVVVLSLKTLNLAWENGRGPTCSGFGVVVVVVVVVVAGLDFPGQPSAGPPLHWKLRPTGQSNFGQSIFGHRVWPANFGQSIFGQN